MAFFFFCPENPVSCYKLPVQLACDHSSFMQKKSFPKGWVCPELLPYNGKQLQC